MANERVFGLSGGTLKVGSQADITIIDEKKKWTVEPDKFKSKGRNTPFTGTELRGVVLHTLVDGKVVYAAAHDSKGDS